jgi:HD superfamily phosphohydrolase
MSWIIKDAVHGVLLFKNPEVCREIIDTPCMQRLRYIKQTAFAYLVFPSAEHTRFQHSLGTAYIAGTIANNLGCSFEEIKKCEVTALLHDIGILPFSHALERGDFGRMHKLSHEEYIVKIIREDEKLQDILHKNSLDSEEIIKILEGGHELSPIIKGPLDADKLDYLQRDSYFTGVKTEIDPYIYHIFYMPPRKREIYAIEKGLGNIEAIFCARYRLTQIVYFHHAVRVANLMLNRAVIDAYEREKIKMNELVKMGDEELLNKLIEAGGYAKELVKRLKERKLYKRVTGFDVGKIEGEAINTVFAKNNSKFIREPRNILRLESFLADKLGLKDKDSILVDIPCEDEFKPPERNIKIWPILTGQEYAYLRSRYIYGIDLIYKELRRMRIYSKERLGNALKEKSRRIIEEIAENPSKVDEIMSYKPWIP